MSKAGEVSSSPAFDRLNLLLIWAILHGTILAESRYLILVFLFNGHLFILVAFCFKKSIRAGIITLPIK